MSKNYIPCLAWVAKGIAKPCPDKVQLSPEELERLIDETKGDIRDMENEEEENDSNAQKKTIDYDSDDIEAKYGLDTYDDDEGESKVFMNLADVAVYTDNKDDEYLTQEGASDDEDEKEDFMIKDSDNLLVVGRVKEDEEEEDQEESPDCSAVLEIYVYNKEEGSFYVHHDIVLPAWPLALEWLNYHPADETSGNYIAVGDMTPVIKIWDLDVVDALEPDMSLGKKVKKKDNPKKCVVKGHKDAVLSLSWNKQLRHTLASGSADTCVILWDLQEAKMRSKMSKLHSGRVQGLQWSPSESSLLLSGCTDGIVKLYDTRTESDAKSWKVEGEIEKVCWNTTNTNTFYCATDQGFVYSMDLNSEEIKNSKQCHTKGINDIDMSKDGKQTLLTSSMDKTVKLWNVANGFEFIGSQKLKVGSIFTSKFAPDSELVVAIGGDNKANNLKVLDINKQLNDMKVASEASTSTLNSSPPPKKIKLKNRLKNKS